MRLLSKLIPGQRPTKEPRDLSDAARKILENRVAVADINDRTDRLERRFFVDDLFPPVTRQGTRRSLS